MHRDAGRRVAHGDDVEWDLDPHGSGERGLELSVHFGSHRPGLGVEDGRHCRIRRAIGAYVRATYGYRHFLQLLAIKIRQREGQTLETIKREMKDVTGDALERRIAQSLAPALVANPVSPATEDDTPVSWRRMSVAEGVELHVRGDSPSSNEQALIAMREAVRAALGRQELR